jgi:PAS domain-containing protein
MALNGFEEAMEIHGAGYSCNGTYGEGRRTAWKVYRPGGENPVMSDQGTLERTGLEARLAALRPGLDVLSLPACILDADLRYVYLNQAYSTHAGRPATDFIGRTPDEALGWPVDGRATRCSGRSAASR